MYRICYYEFIVIDVISQTDFCDPRSADVNCCDAARKIVGSLGIILERILNPKMQTKP